MQELQQKNSDKYIYHNQMSRKMSFSNKASGSECRDDFPHI